MSTIPGTNTSTAITLAATVVIVYGMQAAKVLLVPFLGVIIYHLFADSPIPRWQRLTYVLGGLAAYLIILGVGAVVGGIV